MKTFQTYLAENSIKITKALKGHTSLETAYVVDDYPYGFRLRTKIRYWLEHKPKKGWRLVSQTLNPKTNRWNKPKASTYIDLAAFMYLDDKEHVTWTGVGFYASTEELKDFLKNYRNHLDNIAIRNLEVFIKAREAKGL